MKLVECVHNSVYSFLNIGRSCEKFVRGLGDVHPIHTAYEWSNEVEFSCKIQLVFLRKEHIHLLVNLCGLHETFMFAVIRIFEKLGIFLMAVKFPWQRLQLFYYCSETSNRNISQSMCATELGCVQRPRCVIILADVDE